MKIISAEIQSTKIPVKRPHQMAIGTTHFQENVIVKIIGEDGTFGFGEAPHMVNHSQKGETPDTVRVILHHKIVPAVLGLSALDQEALAVAMDRAIPGNHRAKGAVSIAAYDLAGKLMNTSVHNLLGGKVRDSIPLSWSLPIASIDTVIEEGVQMVERGWSILKVKLGRSRVNEDLDVVRELRSAIGNEISIRADANQAYDVKTALRVVHELDPLGVDFLEQPVHRDDLDGMVEVTRKSGIPIMADESAKSLRELAIIAKRRAADYVSIYVIGPGGLLKSKKMTAIAEAFGMRAYVGSALESIIGVCAGLHLAASSPSINLGCELYSQYLLIHDFGKERLSMKTGALVVPTGPGLGVEVDESKLAKYRVGEVECMEL